MSEKIGTAGGPNSVVKKMNAFTLFRYYSNI